MEHHATTDRKATTVPRRPARVLLVIALLSGLAACGGGGDTQEVDGPVAAGVTPGATLTGTLGGADKPDAFEIGLTDASGATVTTLPAGDYTIVVNDRSRIHNWVLSGDGVDAATDVTGTGEESFQVTLKAGEYTYVCDPHPSMKGSLTVT